MLGAIVRAEESGQVCGGRANKVWGIGVTPYTTGPRWDIGVGRSGIGRTDIDAIWGLS